MRRKGECLVVQGHGGQRNIALRMGLRGSIGRGKRTRREGEIGNTKERKDG